MIDCHAHLIYFEDVDRILNEMEKENLKNIVTIGTTVDDSKWNIDFSKKHKNIYTTVGIYPEYADEINDEDLEEIEKLADDPKVVAIGEIGLDFHAENFNKEKQIEIFEKQLKIANKQNLPFCIHCRKAVQDVYEVLERNKNLINHSGLIHCYSEGSGWYKKFLDLGLYLSFSGNITYKKADTDYLKKIPLDRILVETDSPYLAPQEVRGTRNEPKNVKHVIKFLAEKIGISEEKLEQITEKNARRFYYKMNGENE